MPTLPGIFVEKMEVFSKYLQNRPILIDINEKKTAMSTGNWMGNHVAWGQSFTQHWKPKQSKIKQGSWFNKIMYK
jgi:hypothetical protein